MSFHCPPTLFFRPPQQHKLLCSWQKLRNAQLPGNDTCSRKLFHTKSPGQWRHNLRQNDDGMGTGSEKRDGRGRGKKRRGFPTQLALMSRTGEAKGWKSVARLQCNNIGKFIELFQKIIHVIFWSTKRTVDQSVGRVQ